MKAVIDYSTPEQRAELMESIMEKMDNFLCGLWSRWQDEKDYEDWGDYKRAIVSKIETILPTGSTAQMPRRGSFKIVCTIPGFPYKPTISLTQTSYGWSS